MRARITLVAVFAVAAGSCATDLGPGTPGCSRDGDVATATIMQLQAVPDASWGPCLAELMVGWEYVSQTVKSGETKFWLDSDRMGDEFVEVTLLSACSFGGAQAAASPVEGIDRFVSVAESPSDIAITVVPVAPRHQDHGAFLVADLSLRRIEGRSVDAMLRYDTNPAAKRIEDALAADRFVLIIDDREMARGTVELRTPAGEDDTGLTIDEALEEISDELGALRYRATWYHAFAGGCIVYEFDAKGAGVLTLVDDIDQALGFFPLAELRRAAADAGFEV